MSGSNPNSQTRVIYKPDSQSTEEFMVIVNPEEYKKWSEGETSIPLPDVVDSFNVFVSTQGANGLLSQPSKQQLETVFGSHKDIDVVTHILKNGREQPGAPIKKSAIMNQSRGGMARNENPHF